MSPSSRTSSTLSCPRSPPRRTCTGFPPNRHGRRRALQQGDLRRSRSERAHHLGGVRAPTTMRSSQRGSPRSARPTPTPGPLSCSCWPTTTTSRPQDPDWAEKYTNNQAKYVDQPALAGFEHLQEGFEKGWYQENFGSTTFDDGLNPAGDRRDRPLPDAHLRPRVRLPRTTPTPSRTSATSGSPATTPRLTGRRSGCRQASTSRPPVSSRTWPRQFLAFVASLEGVDAMTAAVAPQGPYMIEGSSLPEDTLPAVLDIQAYIDAGAISTGPGVPVADQRPQPGVPHRGSRVRPQECRGCCCRSTTKTSSLRRSNSACLVGEPANRTDFRSR